MAEITIGTFGKQLMEHTSQLKRRGEWSFSKNVPNKWKVTYSIWLFLVETMGFKHTGLFPEQAVNWDYMQEKNQKSEQSCSGLEFVCRTPEALPWLAPQQEPELSCDAAKAWCEKAKSQSGAIRAQR